MSRKQPRLVPISEIIVSFFVRVSLNNDRVRFFQSLIESNADLPALDIAKGSMDLVDGRHRLAAYSNLGYTEVPCIEEVYSSKNEMILAALRANFGGSLPPSPQDLTHTIECLMAEKLPLKTIVGQVSEQLGMPSKLVRRYIDDIQSKILKRRKAEAVTAIAGGDVTLVQAAEKYSVNIDELKAEISGKPKGESVDDADAIMARLSDKFKRFNHSIGMIMTHILRCLKDGALSESDAKQIIVHYKGLVKEYQTKEKLWTNRFEKLFEVHDASDKIVPKKRQKTEAPKEKKAPVAKKKVVDRAADAALKKMGVKPN